MVTKKATFQVKRKSCPHQSGGRAGASVRLPAVRPAAGRRTGRSRARLARLLPPCPTAGGGPGDDSVVGVARKRGSGVGSAHSPSASASRAYRCHTRQTTLFYPGLEQAPVGSVPRKLTPAPTVNCLSRDPRFFPSTGRHHASTVTAPLRLPCQAACEAMAR